MIQLEPVRHRGHRHRSALAVGAGVVAALGLVLGGVAPSALAATTTPKVAPAPSLQPMAPAVGQSQPGNDDFSAATSVSGYKGMIDGTNVGATAEEGEPTIPVDDGGPYSTVWYQWVAPAAGEVVFDLCYQPTGTEVSSSLDSKLGAYTGPQIWDLNLITYNDDTCGGLSSISFTVEAEATYSIQVDGYDGSTGPFTLEWSLAQPAATVSIGDVTANEGDAGTTSFNFPITLASASESEVSVQWATGDDSATAPDDYASASGTAVFEPGELAATATVYVVGDLVPEKNEIFSVTLTNPDGADLGRARATGTITNDDVSADVNVSVSNFHRGDVRVGAYMAYYIQVVNPDGGDAAAVTVTDPLLENTEVIYAGATQGTCVIGSPVVCELGSMAGGQSVDVIIYFVPSRTGLYKNTVSVTSDISDPDSSNNTASRRTTVVADKAGCTIIGTNGPDEIAGTPGDDVICSYAGNDVVNGGTGDDIIWAGFGNDYVDGGPGLDALYGMNGSDTLVGGADADAIDGGAGFDTVSYASDPGPVTVNLGEGWAVDGYGQSVQTPGETITSVYRVMGSAFGDSLAGSTGVDNLYGQGGDDSIMGDSGPDVLDGGDDTDSINGNRGTDTCTTGETYANCEN